MTYEKCADELEQASHLQEQLNLAGRKASEAALAPQTVGDERVAECVVCEDPLPEVRIVMKRIRCVTCQIAEDKRFKQLGRR